MSNKDSALFYALKAQRIAKDAGMDSAQWQTDITIAEIHGYSQPRNYLKAIEYATGSLKIAERKQKTVWLQKSHSLLGTFYWRGGMHAEATSHRLASLSLSRLNKDRLGEGRALNSLSISYYYNKDYPRAIKHAKEAIAIYRELSDFRYLGQTYINLGSYAMESGEPDSALSYYEAALAIFEKDNSNTDAALSGIGNVFLKKGNFDKARSYYERWAKYLTDQTQTALLHQPYASIAKSYLAEKRFNEARLYYEKALDAMPDKNQPSVYLRDVYDGLAKSCEGLSDFKFATNYLHLWSIQRDSMETRANKNRLNELILKNEINEQRQSLELAQKDRLIYRLTFALLSGIVILVIVGGIWIVRKLTRNFKKRAAEINLVVAEKNRLLEIQAQNEELLKGELDSKSRELMSFTLQMIHKNEELDALKTELESLKAITAGDIQKRISKLQSRIYVAQQLDKNWDNFRLYFDQVHNGFFDNLKAKCPSLSPMDFKIGALVKMNMNTKQMAAVLDISPESTKVAKHRLKRKLNLDVSQDLKVFLDTLS